MEERVFKLRAWSFLGTALGGFLLALGSLLTWATIGFSRGLVGPATKVAGIDMVEGLGDLVLGVLIVLAIFAMRKVATKAKRILAIVILVFALAGGALAGAALLRGDTRFLEVGTQNASADISAATGLPQEGVEQVAEASSGFATIQIGIGVWITLGGAPIAFVGGLASRRWIRVREEWLAQKEAERSETG